MLLGFSGIASAAKWAGSNFSSFGEVRDKLIGIYSFLIVFNGLAWAFALLSFQPYPVLLGTALLAYTFGLRHAFDADHIAAIDNVIRKLMQDGQRPVAVGLFFSLGHSTLVILASAAIAVTASAFKSQVRGFEEITGVAGTAISAAFLFAIAFANILILINVHRTLRRVRSGGQFVEEHLDILLANRGLLGRVFRPAFKLIGKSWHMYPLGLMFALGFDTATEIGVLAMSAAGAAQGLPIWNILIFPALFTAGMTLADTTDGVLMLGAYGWAFAKPVRKLYYNLTITFVSVVVALVIGGIEMLSIIGDKLGLDHGFWAAIATLNGNFAALGYVIIAIFVTSWIVSILAYRLMGYD